MPFIYFKLSANVLCCRYKQYNTTLAILIRFERSINKKKFVLHERKRMDDEKHGLLNRRKIKQISIQSPNIK